MIAHPDDTLKDAHAETLFPAQSSVLDESALLERVVHGYEIEPATSCRFLERGDGDIYRVKTRRANYYLKVYRPPKPAAHAESEALFVNRLAKAGLPVVRAVRRKDGAFACAAQASEGLRPILLFEEAPPPLPAVPNIEHLTDLGAVIARMHALADEADSPVELPTFDLTTIVTDLSPHIRRFATREDASFMEAVIEWIRRQLCKIPCERPEWGICHADLVLSNVRAGAHGVTLFDFGSIARSYRGFELAIIHWSLGHRDQDRRQALWDALLEGYESIRPLPDAIEEYLPLFLAMRELAFLGGNAATLPLRLGTNPFESRFMEDGFDRIRSILAATDLASG